MSLQPDLPEEVIALAATAEAPPRMARRSFWTRAWRELKHAPLTAWIGLIVVAIYIFAAVFAPLIAPYGETALVGDAYEPWGDQFLLGTDQLGRDMLSRLIFGARNTMGIAFLTTIFAFLIGGTLGLLSATLGGWVDQVLGRAVDVLMAIPQLIFALVLLSIVGTVDRSTSSSSSPSSIRPGSSPEPRRGDERRGAGFRRGGQAPGREARPG